MKYWIHALITCVLVVSCCRPPDLDGVWIMTTADPAWHALVNVKGDAMWFIHPTHLSRVAHPMDLTCDSLNGPDPCSTDRMAFSLQGDTVFLDRGLFMYKPGRIEQAHIHTNIHRIYLREVDTPSHGGPTTHFTPFFIGPCQRNNSCPETFLGGHGLAIQDQYADSASIVEWLHHARTDWPEGSPRAAVIYADTSVGQRILDELTDRIHHGLDGDVTIYQGYFMPTAEYHLTFDILRIPLKPALEQ